MPKLDKTVYLSKNYSYFHLGNCVSKSLCKMSRKQVAENIDELGSSVSSAKYICRACSRVANEKGRLCKAQTISNCSGAAMSGTVKPDLKLATANSSGLTKQSESVQKAVTLAKEKRRNIEQGAQSTSEVRHTLKSMKKECKRLKKEIKLHKKLLKLSKKHRKLAKKRTSLTPVCSTRSTHQQKEVDLH